MKSLSMVAFVFALTACGSVKVSGNTKHEVAGEAVIKLDIDMSICDSLPEADRAECIKALIDILSKAKKPAAE